MVSSELNDLYKIRFKGEAYALRGCLKYYLLLTTGGIGDNGELLGIPIYNEFIARTVILTFPVQVFRNHWMRFMVILIRRWNIFLWMITAILQTPTNSASLWI